MPPLLNGQLQGAHFEHGLGRYPGEQNLLVRPRQSGCANLPLLLPQDIKMILLAFPAVCCEGFAHFPPPITILVIIRHQGSTFGVSLRFPFFPQCAITRVMLRRMLCAMLIDQMRVVAI